MSKVVVLCGRPRGCCPEVHIEEEGVKITDDYGGEVNLTGVEFELLKSQILAGEL